MSLASSLPETGLLPSQVRLGWIGTGVMGVPMCEHLLRVGYGLTVWTRTPSKATTLLEQGARWAESPSAVAADADVIGTMVGFPQDVRDVYLQSDGLLAQARAGQVCIDFTTSEPTLARKLAKVASEKGASVLDAPVSGGDVGAKNGALSIMVGGTKRYLKPSNPCSRFLPRRWCITDWRGAASMRNCAIKSRLPEQ